MPYDDLCMQSIGMNSQRVHQCQRIASAVEVEVARRRNFVMVVSMPSCLLVAAEEVEVVAIVTSIRILITISLLRLWRSIVSILLWWSSHSPSAWLFVFYV
jgi:hypothetical protein